MWVQTQKWIRENNSEFIDFVTKVTGNDPKITELTINKRDWNDPVPGEELLNSIRIVTPLLGDDVLRPGVNVDNVLASLIDPAPAKKVLGA